MGSKLTSEQHALILGTLLGDGCLEKQCKNPRLRIGHSLHHQDYVFWKYDILGNIVSKEPYIVREKHLRTEKIYSHWYFSSRSIPDLEFYYQLFYREKRKIISKEFIHYFDKPLSLAVWLMDDGYKRNDCDALRLSTDCFSHDEQLILRYCLDKNFGICSVIHKKGATWNIYIPSVEMGKVRALLNEYIVPSMQYKLLPRNDFLRTKSERIAALELL